MSGLRNLTIEHVAAAAGITPLTQPPLISAEQLTYVQAILDQIAAQTGSDYVALHRYTRKESGRAFYGVNLHIGDAVRHAHSDSLAAALTDTMAREVFIAPLEADAA